MTLTHPTPQRHEPIPIRTHPLKLVAIGDSLIYGYGDPEGGGWVERCRRRWMHGLDPGIILYNLGVRGDGVSQVLSRFEFEFRSRGELRQRLPDGLILSVGLNDSAKVGRSHGRNMTEFGTFNQDLEQLLQQASQLCPVWVIGMPPVDERRMPYGGCLYFSHAEQLRYKEATRYWCETFNIPYLEVFDHWLAQGEPWWRSRLIEDGIHPNVSGYHSLFEAVTHWEPLMSFIRDSQISY